MAIRSFSGGVHPLQRIHHGKIYTSDKAIVEMPAPQFVVIPMTRVAGAPLEPIVKKGDHVKLGQKIGESKAFVSAPIHASVSGVVKAIEPRMHPGGKTVTSIVIENDGTDELDESVQPCSDYRKLTSQELLQIVKEKGIVGLGGATFPTHVKFTIPKGKTVDSLIANGAECEPYLTADHRLMLERSADVITGIQITLKILGIDHAYIGIEANKPDAIRVMREAAGVDSRIQVVPLRVKYPQGSEKQLISAILKRDVPSGGLPADAGAVVSNVGTLASIADAVVNGMPVVKRVVTVSGGGVKNPGNLLVRIGTSFQACVDACGGTTEDASKFINGGPMMGVALPSLEVPVIAGTSGILVLNKKQAEVPPESPCVRCGRCVAICPIGLLPLTIAEAVDRKDYESALHYKIMDCIECGSCVYGCPAKRNMLQKIRLAKQVIREKGLK